MGSAKTPEVVSSDFSLMVIGSLLLFTPENTPRNRNIVRLTFATLPHTPPHSFCKVTCADTRFAGGFTTGVRKLFVRHTF